MNSSKELDAQRLLNELQVHQIELEVQNEELRRAQEILADSEQRYRTIIKDTSVGYFNIDRDGLFQRVNDGWLQMHGYDSPEEVIGQHFSKAQVSSDLEAANRNVEKLLSGETIRSGEFSRLRKDGTIGYHSFSAHPVFQNGEVTGLEGFLIDITDRKKAEDNYRTLFQEMLDGFALHEMIYDTGGNPVDYRFLTVNPSFERMIGLKGSELVGRTVLEILPGTERYWIETYGKVALTGKPALFENFSAELAKYFEVKAFRPAPNQFACIISDITERKNAEKLIRESEAKYRKLLEMVPLSICHVTKDGIIDFRNECFNRIIGYSVEEVPDLATWWIRAYPDPQYRQQVTEAWNATVNSAAATGKEIEPLEYRITCKNGEERAFEVAGIIMGEEMLVILIDVTEHKQAEEEKTILESQLHQAQKLESVGRLAGGVAHDFNNMLGVILGHADMALMKMVPTASFRTNLEEIRKAANRSADLTRQLLAFARKQTIAPLVLDLNDAVSGMLKMLQRLIGEDIHLVWQPGNGIGQVMMDPSQIDQVLANLCVNARDAIKDVGKITIETGNFTFDEASVATQSWAVAGDYVRLAISDNGCGMDREVLAHIFEPFFTTKETGKGTGLGLATVYGIVKQNNGFINVYSESGAGTTFKIYIPRHRGEGGGARTEAVARPVRHGDETILLVEDELLILELAADLLKELGYTVLSANTPVEALCLAREYTGKISLLLTDVVMPEMNGRDLAAKLLSVRPDLKCLFMSGYTANVIAHHGVLDEGVNFIQKPFSLGSLASRLREVLDA